MRTYLFFTIAFLLWLQPYSSHAQQQEWILPVNTLGADVIRLDFRSGNPVVSYQPIANQTSSQAIGNGAYCNNCANNNLLQSEFWITGSMNNLFNPTTIGGSTVYGLMASYEQIDNCNFTQEILRDQSSNVLSHSSLAEISIGAGEERGTFWIVAQDYDNNIYGDGFIVYNADFNTATPFQISYVIDNTVITGATNFHEGVALGPRFIYDGTLPNSVAAWDGRLCRSIYVSTGTDGDNLNQVLLWLDAPSGTTNFLLYDNTASNMTNTKVNHSPTYHLEAEIELSFPVNSGLRGNHPRWLSTTGHGGLHIFSLDANGHFNTSNMKIRDHGVYGVEFDQLNNYLYYAYDPNTSVSTLQSSSSKTVARFDLTNYAAGSFANQSGQILTLPGGTTVIPVLSGGCAPLYQNFVIETAGNDRIYLLDNDARLFEIADPSAFNVTNVGFSELMSGGVGIIADFIANNTTTPSFNACNVGFGFPDWVDGEDPLEIQGVKLEICINNFDCSEVDDQTVEVQFNGSTVQTLNITPGHCQELFVCPNENIPYEIILNGGQDQQNVFALTSASTISFDIGGVTGFGSTTAVVLNDFTIDSDEKWTGTIIIPEMVTVSNMATLDITNADLIFYECAGITLDAGIIRANNAVLRPCEVTETWYGVELHAGSVATVNECTFKNARAGLSYLGGSGIATMRVANNLFANCWVGVYIENVNYLDGITGNTFMLEYFPSNFDGPSFPFLDYEPAGCSAMPFAPYTDVVFGILFDNVDAIDGSANRGHIAQNDFVDMVDVEFPATDPRPEMVGISMTNSDANINGNNFSNNRMAIDATGFGGLGVFNIEDNEIEVTEDGVGFDAAITGWATHQINLVGVGGAYVAGNTLTNTRNDNRNFGNAGINIEATATGGLVNIYQNEISGFSIGTRLINTSFVNVWENVFTGCYHFGVDVEHGDDVDAIDIACNTITLDVPVTGDAVGIGMILGGDDQTNLIVRNNCVYETTRAIYLENTSGSTVTIPVVYNNFLYNYRDIGVDNIGYSGGIGSGNTPSTAGKNTFAGNNDFAYQASPIRGVDVRYIDLSASGAFLVAGNYGVTNNLTNNSINLVGNNNYHSSASCGGQIVDGVNNAIIEGVDNCRDLEQGDGYFSLYQDAQTRTIPAESTKPATTKLGYINSIFEYLKGQGLVNDLYAAWMGYRVDESLDAQQRQWVDYYYYLTIEDYGKALFTLNAIQGNNVDETEMISMYQILLQNNAMENRSYTLTDDQVEVLRAIEERGGSYQNMAVAIINGASNVAYGLYHLKTLPQLWSLEHQNLHLSNTESYLKIRNNPTSDIFEVEYFIDDIENAMVEVYNIQGRKLYSFELIDNLGSEKMDISSEESGIYFIMLRNAKGVKASQKLIKL